jgi:hypothetical protein
MDTDPQDVTQSSCGPERRVGPLSKTFIEEDEPSDDEELLNVEVISSDIIEPAHRYPSHNIRRSIGAMSFEAQ